jgi:hypothetical protein
MELASLVLASLVLHINMVLVLVLLAEQRGAVLLAAESRLELASLMLASLALDIYMVLVLVHLAEKRHVVLLAAEMRMDLASFLLAPLVEPRSAYERSDLQRQPPGSSQGAQSRHMVGVDEGAGS